MAFPITSNTPDGPVTFLRVVTLMGRPASKVLYNWLIWRVLKLAFFSEKYFPCI